MANLFSKVVVRFHTPILETMRVPVAPTSPPTLGMANVFNFGHSGTIGVFFSFLCVLVHVGAVCAGQRRLSGTLLSTLLPLTEPAVRWVDSKAQQASRFCPHSAGSVRAHGQAHRCWGPSCLSMGTGALPWLSHLPSLPPVV